MKTPLVFAVGLALGLSVGWFGGARSAPAASASTSAPSSGPADTKHSARPTLADSASAGQDALPSRKPRLDVSPGIKVLEGGEPANPEQIKEVMAKLKEEEQKKRAHRIDERLAALRSRLNLTPDQEAKIRALLESSPDLAGGGILGGISLADGATTFSLGGPAEGETQAAHDEKLAALLTAEQKEKFAAFQQEQRENRIEIDTNREMAQLQQQLTLTPEQKDQAYQTLSDLARREDSQSAGSPFDPETIEARTQARLDALRPILTPEQLKAYESAPIGLFGVANSAISIRKSLPLDGGK